MLRFCPGCNNPVAKDKSCDHVSCDECKFDWLYCCSIKRSPFTSHTHDKYHREGCRLRNEKELKKATYKPEPKPDPCNKPEC